MEATELRLAMLANGYQPLPAQGKRVLLEGWSTKATVASSEVSAWGTEHPQWNNTGTLTAHTPTIDGDIRDPAAAEAFEELVRDWLDERGRILVRIGDAPKRAILCRTAQPFAKIKVDLVAPSGSTHKIEILGDGQQLVVAGIHPDTRKPYSWHGGEPWTVQWSELPEITEAEAQEFYRARGRHAGTGIWLSACRRPGQRSRTRGGIIHHHADCCRCRTGISRHPFWQYSRHVAALHGVNAARRRVGQ